MTPVYIEWRDSVYSPGWNRDEPAPITIKTIAWLIEKTDTHIIVTSHHDGEGQWHTPMGIPFEAVVAYYELILE